MLVDGGITDNIPLDVAREMEVDIAIVVDIGTPLSGRNQLTTVADVLNQSITLMSRCNSEEQLATLHPDDVLIQPSLASFGVADFGRTREMIDAGTLVINAHGKRSGTDYLRLGINLSDDLRGDSAFNLGASYRVNGINRLGAEWLTRAQIGDQQELYSEFYQPLDVGSRYFIAPYAAIESQNVETILDNDPIAQYRLERYGFGLNVGRQISNNGEIRFGVGEAWGKADVRIGDQDLPSEDFNEGFYELKYSFDTLDNVYFPHEGEDIGLTLRQFEPQLGSDKRYRQWEFKLDKALSSAPDTFILGGRLGRTTW